MIGSVAPGSQHEKREPPVQSASIWKRTRAKVSEVAASRRPIERFAASATEAEVFRRRNGDIGGDDADGRCLGGRHRLAVSANHSSRQHGDTAGTSGHGWSAAVRRRVEAPGRRQRAWHQEERAADRRYRGRSTPPGFSRPSGAADGSTRAVKRPRGQRPGPRHPCAVRGPPGQASLPGRTTVQPPDDRGESFALPAELMASERAAL